MAKVGVRELKLHANEIVHRVEEEHAIYEVTLEGSPIAVLEPASVSVDKELLEELWAERRRLAEEITKNWNGTLTVAEAIRQERSDW
jgi:prevent-host-death family protein